MKAIYLLLLSFFAFSASANDAENDMIYIRTETAQKYLKNDRSPCYLAVGGEAYNGAKNWFWPKILCVLDGVYKQGSAEEKRGCSLMVLDLKTGKLEGLVRSLSAAPATFTVADKNCLDGGINQMLKQKPFIYNMKEQDAPTNQEYLYTGTYATAIGKDKLHLLFANDDKLKNIYSRIKESKGKAQISYEKPSLLDKFKKYFQ